MDIEVWSTGLTGRPIRQGNLLKMTADRGAVVAFWKEGLLGLKPRVLVGYEFAVEVLEVERGPCKFVGRPPVYTIRPQDGYTVRSSSSGEDSVSHLRCSVCGLWQRSGGGARFRGFSGIAGDLHPERDILTTARPATAITQADWSEHGLVAPARPGRLIIYVGSDPPRDNAFPGAKIVASGKDHYILEAAA